MTAPSLARSIRGLAPVASRTAASSAERDSGSGTICSSGRSSEADDERDPGTVDQPRPDVAPELVGAEREAGIGEGAGGFAEGHRGGGHAGG